MDSPGKNRLDAFIIVSGRVVSLLIGIVTIRVTTSILSPTEIGRMSIFLTAIGLFAMLLISPIGLYVNRQILGWEKSGTLRRNLALCAAYVLCVGLLAAALVAAVGKFHVFDESTTSLRLAAIIFLGIFVTSNYSSFISYLNLFRMRLTFVALNNASRLAAFGLSVALALSFARTAELWLLGQYIAQFLFFAAAAVMLFRLGRRADPGRDVTFDNIQRVARFSLPLALSVLFSWAQTQGYRFILQKEYGLETLGIFFVTFNIGVTLITAFEDVFTQFYHPIFYSDVTSDDPAKRTAAWNAYASAYFPSLLMTLLFIGSCSPFLIRFLTAPRYWPFGMLIAFGAAAEGIRILTSAYSLAAHAEYKTKSLVLPSALSALSAIALICWLPRYDLFTGIAMSLVIAGLIGLAALAIEIRKVMPAAFPAARVVQSALLCLPLFLLLWIARHWGLSGNYWSLGMLVAMSAYFVAGQLLFARAWLKDTL